MPDENTPGATGTTETTQQQPAGEPAQGAEATKPAATTQVVTPEILQGVIGRFTRTAEENSKKMADNFQKQLEAVMAKLEDVSKATHPTKGEGGKGTQGDSGAALLELEKKSKDLEARLMASEKKAQEAEHRERDYKFRTKLESALARNKCTDIRAAYLVLKEEPLTFDPESEKITVKVKDTQFGIGEVDVDIDQYIKNTFSEEIMPYVFSGKVRPGAPASGDSGPGGAGSKGVWKESEIQRMPLDDYIKNRDKIEEARKLGKVVADVGGPIHAGH